MLSSTPKSIPTPTVKVSTEKQAFTQVFDVLVKDLKQDFVHYRLPDQGAQWIETMLNYTCVGGKMNRGLTVKSSLESILKQELSQDQVLRSQVLGWCVELLQAFFLVADDIMDASITRRGQPCWYRNDRVGMIAINDAFILESAIYRLLKKYFKTESYYTDLLDLFHEVTYQTELGQLMDLITAPEGDVDLSRFSISKQVFSLN
jgi:farnesyl diphosphate synthase